MNYTHIFKAVRENNIKLEVQNEQRKHIRAYLEMAEQCMNEAKKQAVQLAEETGSVGDMTVRNEVWGICSKLNEAVIEVRDLIYD